MKIFPVALLMMTFTASTSFAAKYYSTPENECTTVDFRETLNLKMRNQNNVSWCFAHAASDYLQYAFNLEEQISAADVAINYSQTSASRLIHFFKGIIAPNSRALPAQTGFIKLAVKKIIPQGYCPESALPSDEWNRVESNNSVESKVEIKQSILDTFALQKKVKSGEINSASDLPWYFKFKNIDRDGFYDLLKHSKKTRLMLNLRAAACKNERKPFGSQKVGSDFQIRGKYVFKNMNATFNRKMPVTIDFFSDIFRNFDHPKNNLNDLHTVLVYGRKFDSVTGQCNYMLKDSYGEQCKKYDPKIPCEGGYVWLPENKLFKAMTSQLIIYKK
jgi:hypothetical protein